jgi:uncharacterized protein YndB with AHSA1/START domain
MKDENVFKALADPTRRKLLDRLFRRDGQTLGALADGLDMTRFGAMKHLRVLEDAHLVATRKVGREKLHYLNPIPIRRLHDRWISKFREPITEALVMLKDELEGNEVMNEPHHVYEVYIRTTPEKLWRAITDGSITRKYFHKTRVESTFQKGASIAYLLDDGSHALDGEILEVVPQKRLVVTFVMTHDAEARRDRPSRVTWEIEAGDKSGVCKLTLMHDDFDGETTTYRSVRFGWNPVLSGLKTILETGAPLEIPASA